MFQQLVIDPNTAPSAENSFLRQFMLGDSFPQPDFSNMSPGQLPMSGGFGGAIGSGPVDPARALTDPYYRFSESPPNSYGGSGDGRTTAGGRPNPYSNVPTPSTPMTGGVFPRPDFSNTSPGQLPIGGGFGQPTSSTPMTGGVTPRSNFSNMSTGQMPAGSTAAGSSNLGSTAAGVLGGIGVGASGLLDGIGEGISNFLGGLSAQDIANAGLGAGALAAIYKGYDDLGDIGDTAYTRGGEIAQQGLEQTQFKPFTVTSSTGGMFSADPGGNVTMGLGGQEQAIQNALMAQAQQGIAGGFGGDPMQQAAAQQAYGLGGQFMGMAGQDPMQRERDIYGNIRAMQSPEEERQRMALEERLFSQGRGGVSTNMYGGTPEQLSMAKAQAEAQNQASLMAMQQAQAEQLQQANIGSTFAGLGSQLGARDMATQAAQQQLALGNLVGAYAPQNQLLQVQEASQLFPQLQQRGQLAGAGMFGEASMSGLEAYLGAGLGQANLLGALGSGLLSGIFK